MKRLLPAMLLAAGVIGVALIATPVGAAVLEQASSIRRGFYPQHIVANHTDATFQVDQTGTGSIANFKDGGVSEYTFDQSSYTFLNAGTQATGDVTAAEVADVVRYENIPLRTFIDCDTDAGADINFTSGADAIADFINSATDGTGFTLTFDDTGTTEDQSTEVCSQLTVPADYVSGGAFRIRAVKDAQTAATEVLNCAVSVNGAALEAAGTTTTTAAASTSYACTPTIASLAANDSLSFYLSITSATTMDDTVNIASVAFFYTATQ